MIDKDKILGRITHVHGQWHRAERLAIGWPKNDELSADDLKRCGYESMEQFRNWRWYKRFSGGPMADLGSHQVDVFNWVLKTPPRAVLASGGRDYYEDIEWYDNVMAIYEYAVGGSIVRGYYEVLSTTSHGGYYETFMGDEGSMVVSEDPRKGFVFREVKAKRREWEDEAAKIENMGRDAIELKIGETLAPDGKPTAEAQKMLEESQKPIHQLHLENFFRAIREGTPLSCPPEVGFETAVSVLLANDAVAASCGSSISSRRCSRSSGSSRMVGGMFMAEGPFDAHMLSEPARYARAAVGAGAPTVAAGEGGVCRDGLLRCQRPGCRRRAPTKMRSCARTAARRTYTA